MIVSIALADALRQTKVSATVLKMVHRCFFGTPPLLLDNTCERHGSSPMALTLEPIE